MQFYSYLNENNDFEQLKKVLKKKCAPVLKELAKTNGLDELPMIGKNTKLKRGFRIRKTRKNREPRDTPEEIHGFHRWLFSRWIWT